MSCRVTVSSRWAMMTISSNTSLGAVTKSVLRLSSPSMLMRWRMLLPAAPVGTKIARSFSATAARAGHLELDLARLAVLLASVLELGDLGLDDHLLRLGRPHQQRVGVRVGGDARRLRSFRLGIGGEDLGQRLGHLRRVPVLDRVELDLLDHRHVHQLDDLADPRDVRLERADDQRVGAAVGRDVQVLTHARGRDAVPMLLKPSAAAEVVARPARSAPAAAPTRCRWPTRRQTRAPEHVATFSASAFRIGMVTIWTGLSCFSSVLISFSTSFMPFLRRHHDHRVGRRSRR